MSNPDGFPAPDGASLPRTCLLVCTKLLLKNSADFTFQLYLELHAIGKRDSALNYVHTSALSTRRCVGMNILSTGTVQSMVRSFKHLNCVVCPYSGPNSGPNSELQQTICVRSEIWSWVISVEHGRPYNRHGTKTSVVCRAHVELTGITHRCAGVNTILDLTSPVDRRSVS